MISDDLARPLTFPEMPNRCCSNPEGPRTQDFTCPLPQTPTGPDMVGFLDRYLEKTSLVSLM